MSLVFMVNIYTKDERLKIRLRSLDLQEKTLVRKAVKNIKDSFQKMRDQVYEHHFTRMGAAILQEVYDSHELIKERDLVESEKRFNLDLKHITTFVGFKLNGNASQYYIFSPSTSKGRQSCSLSRDLATHIRGSIQATKIFLDNTNPKEIIYHCYSHPFLFYQCNALNRNFIHRFHESFTKLVTMSQPRNFSTYKLEHQISCISEQVLNLLKHRDWNDIFTLEEQLIEWDRVGRSEISYKELAPIIDMGEITIKRLATQREFIAAGPESVTLESLKNYFGIELYKKRVHLYRNRNKLNFNSASLEERREEAFARLSEKKDTLTFHDISYVLGISHMSAKELSRIESRNGNWPNLNMKRGRGKIAQIPSDYIEQYIQSHIPTNRGWSYREAYEA